MAGNAEQAGGSLKRRSPSVQARASDANTFGREREMNNSTDVSVVTPETIPVIAHSGRPVVTTALLARLYGTEAKRIQNNYMRNADRFEQGKHFFKLEGKELANLRPSLGGSQISAKARSLMLWTERGAARHAKMLETNEAWDVFEKMEDCYFAKAEPETPLLQRSGLTPAQQRHVQNRVSELACGDRMKYATIYRSIKDRFMVGSYKDVPESEYPALCMMLMCDPLEGEWIASGKSKGMQLSEREVQALYLMMSHYHFAMEWAMKSGIYAIARMTDSRPLSNFNEHFSEMGMGFRTLDERRDEIYRIYSQRGAGGGYAMQAAS